jgi:hypothetical protein
LWWLRTDDPIGLVRIKQILGDLGPMRSVVEELIRRKLGQLVAWASQQCVIGIASMPIEIS